MFEQKIPLSRDQQEIIDEFYSRPQMRVIFDKRERNDLWRKATSRSDDLDFEMLDAVCPALAHRIRVSYETGNNIQSAVFSECVYAQTFANIFNLNLFVNCLEYPDFIPTSILRLLDSYHLVPRYVYSSEDRSRMLIQAGGCGGIDSALITVINLVIYTIEFKEPGAKTSEPDLPKYGEDGFLVVNDSFLERYPQFELMLREQEGLNFFEVMGSNINNFSLDSINFAVSNNYAKKYADVVVTEDINGFLTMMPANQVGLWAEVEGEIRPAGRNHYNVWTPNALKSFLTQMGATFNGCEVMVAKENLGIRKERGGDGRVSGFKITPLFFVYIEDCSDYGTHVSFDIRAVQQLNPTIAGKMFFRTLKYSDVERYYCNEDRHF